MPGTFTITVSRVGLEALEITGTLSLVDAAADPAWDGRILLWTPDDPSEYTRACTAPMGIAAAVSETKSPSS